MSEDINSPNETLDLEAVKQDFLNYLDGNTAPLFIAESLSQMLRVAPPIHFSPKEIAAIVIAWASLRAPAEQKPMHEFFLKSIKLIVTADRTGVLSAFKPSPFYMPFFEGLVRGCPTGEKDSFREKLKQLRADIFKEWGYQFRQVEAEITLPTSQPEIPVVISTPSPEIVAPSVVESSADTAAINVDLMVRESLLPEDLGELIQQLRTVALRLPQEQKDEYLVQLQIVIDQSMRQPRFIITPYLESLIDIAIVAFNGSETFFAAQILYVVQQVYNTGRFDEALREYLRGCRRVAALNDGHLKNFVSNPDLLPAVRVFLSHFDEFSPYNLLHTLSYETDNQKRKTLLALMEAHGEDGVPMIIYYLNRVDIGDAAQLPYLRNLIYLLGRAAPQDEEGQQGAINLISPFLKSRNAQLRATAITSLERFTIDEVLSHIKQVFNEKIYSEEELNNEERLVNLLSNAINIIGRHNSNAAVQLLTQMAQGHHVNLLSDKYQKPLRLQAMQILISKQHLLTLEHINPLMDHIRNATNSWKKLMSRFLGEDETIMMTMLNVLATVPFPVVKELLNDVKTRYAKEPLGRHAGDLLAQIQR